MEGKVSQDIRIYKSTLRIEAKVARIKEFRFVMKIGNVYIVVRHSR